MPCTYISFRRVAISKARPRDGTLIPRARCSRFSCAVDWQSPGAVFPEVWSTEREVVGARGGRWLPADCRGAGRARAMTRGRAVIGWGKGGGRGRLGAGCGLAIGFPHQKYWISPGRVGFLRVAGVNVLQVTPSVYHSLEICARRKTHSSQPTSCRHLLQRRNSRILSPSCLVVLHSACSPFYGHRRLSLPLSGIFGSLPPCVF